MKWNSIDWASAGISELGIKRIEMALGGTEFSGELEILMRVVKILSQRLDEAGEDIVHLNRMMTLASVKFPTLDLFGEAERVLLSEMTHSGKGLPAKVRR